MSADIELFHGGEVVAVSEWTYETVVDEYWKQAATGCFTDTELVDQLELRTRLPRQVIEAVIDRELFNTSVKVEVVELGDVA